MCCWHSLWLRCVSSKAVRHSLVTQGELLISQERDVLASALGSFEDKQCASPVDGVVMASATQRRSLCREVLRETLQLLTFPFLHSPLPPPPPAPRACPHGQPDSCTVLRLCTATVCVEPRPHVNPMTFRVHSGRSGENNHVMQEYLFGNRMF